jgi:cation transport ATPase
LLPVAAGTAGDSVQFWAGARFIAVHGTPLRGAANMDALVALGTTAAYVYSALFF